MRDPRRARGGCAGSSAHGGCRSGSGSVLKREIQLVIFISGKADGLLAERALCERSKCLPCLPRSSVDASLTLVGTDRAAYGFPFPNSVHDGLGRVVKAMDQNVIY